MRDIYTNEHWEELIDTVIDRIGVERFFEMLAYVLEQRGLSVSYELLRPLAMDTNDAD